MAKGDLTITLEQRDVEHFNRILGNMKNVEGTQEVKSALNTGISLIMNTGKANLAARNKKKTGNLSRSFRKSVQKSAAYAGFKRATVNGKNKNEGGNHAHLIDRGTAKRWTKSGHYTGSVSKNSPNTGTLFWTNAVESQGPAARDTLMQGIYDALQKITHR